VSESHNQWIAEVFGRASTGFGEMECSHFNYFGEKLVEFAQLKQNERVLDVATGKAAVLSAAAQKLGPQSQIVGIDLSEKMLEEAKKKLPAWVELKQMNAEHLEFPDHTFDVVFCACAIYFFSNVQTVLSEFKRVLKPGGRLLMSSFGNRPSLNHWTYLRAQQLGAMREMRIKRFDSIESLIEQFELANLTHIQTRKEPHVITFENGDLWWNSLWTHGMRALLEQLSPQSLEALRQESFAQAKELFPSKKIEIDHLGIFISGRVL
jgi:ubiquinone/menaquinone biosynthesis C-methylase UbiE